MSKSIYKIKKVKDGWAVRHRVQDKDIVAFRGEKARKRAMDYKAELEKKAQELASHE
jgi:hypothetical protein